MVTLEEARRQIQERKRILQQQRQSVQNVILPTPSRAQRLTQTRETLKQRKIASQQLEGQKQSALQTISGQESQLKQAQQQVAEAEARRQALISQQQGFEEQIKIAKKFADKPEFFKFLDPELRKIAQSEAEIRRARLDYAKAIKEAENAPTEVVSAQIKPSEIVVPISTQLFTPLPPSQIKTKQTILGPSRSLAGKSIELISKGVKQITKETERERKANLQLAAEAQYSPSELLKMNRPEAASRQLFFKGGEKFLMAVSKPVSKVIGLPKPTTQEIKTGGEILGTFGLSAFFSPAFETATTAQKAVQKKIGETKFSGLGKELDKAEKIQTVKGIAERKLLAQKTRSGQIKVLKDLAKNVKTKEQAKGFIKFVNEMVSKNIIKAPPSGISVVTPTTKQATSTLVINAFGTFPKSLKAAGGITGILASVNKISLKAKEEEEEKEIEAKKQPGRLFIDPFGSELTINLLGLSQGSGQKTKQKQRGGQGTSQILSTPQTTAQPQVPILSTPQATTQTTRQIQRQVPRQRPRQIPRQAPRQTQRPRIKMPIPPIIPSTSDVATLKKLASIAKKKQGVDIVTGMKKKRQRTIGKNLPPYKALLKAARFVDQNIEASFVLKPSGKQFKGKDISPTSIGRKFRPSKRNPLFLVEKRKYRLDSPLEKRQIKSFPKIKTKRRKKKR